MKIETNSDKANLVEVSEMVLMYTKGFKWVARNEIGSLYFFREEPIKVSQLRGSSTGYDFWINKDNFPIIDYKAQYNSEFGNLYPKITFSEGPTKVLDYLSDKDPLLVVKLTGGEIK